MKKLNFWILKDENNFSNVKKPENLIFLFKKQESLILKLNKNKTF